MTEMSRTGLAALAISLSLYTVAGGALFLLTESRPASPARGAIQTKSAQQQPVAPKEEGHDDPYSPDCDIIRKWLKRHEGDVKVLSWGKRTVVRDLHLGGQARLDARWRRGSHTKTGHFTIGSYDTVENVVISD